ncbi:hypothetical protein [Streptomyces sp. NPDC020681]|uniref:hypothetical protein n=1 Tax=Streptomyces sp. NPDC020681 TaxID=3365083 RepID=UPI00378ABE4B
MAAHRTAVRRTRLLGAQVRATVRVRVLAMDEPQVWIAVSGRLSRTTAPVLAYALRAREEEGFTALFVDVSTLTDDHDVPADVLRELFPCGTRMTFHIIGPADDLGLQTGQDPRFVFHPGPASAWTVWVRGPSTKGRRGARPSARTRSRRSSLGSIT